jgi:hypothetical protein
LGEAAGDTAARAGENLKDASLSNNEPAAASNQATGGLRGPVETWVQVGKQSCQAGIASVKSGSRDQSRGLRAGSHCRQKARELVRRDPDLAFSLLPGEHPLSCADLADEASFEVNVSGVHDFWLPILLNTLSEQAYVLGLKSQLTCDFATPTTVHVKCNGRETSCKAFDDYIHVLMEYIDSRQCDP